MKLIRWPNLVFIILTQLLFYYCIYIPLFPTHNYFQLSLLVLASILIAAAGYIINDYFDLNIDQVNKPDENVFVRQVNRRRETEVCWGVRTVTPLPGRAGRGCELADIRSRPSRPALFRRVDGSSGLCHEWPACPGITTDRRRNR